MFIQPKNSLISSKLDKWEFIEFNGSLARGKKVIQQNGDAKIALSSARSVFCEWDKNRFLSKDTQSNVKKIIQQKSNRKKRPIKEREQKKQKEP